MFITGSAKQETWVQATSLYPITLPASPPLGSLPSQVLLPGNETGWHLAASHSKAPSGLAVRAFPWELTDGGFKIPHTVEVFEHKSQHTGHALKPICYKRQYHILFLKKKKKVCKIRPFCVSCFKAQRHSLYSSALLIVSLCFLIKLMQTFRVTAFFSSHTAMH